MQMTILHLTCLLYLTFQASCKKEVSIPAPGSFALLSPKADTTGIDPLVSFAWEASTGAGSYHLVVARDAQFNNIVLDVPSIKENHYTTNNPLAAGTLFYWKVTAANANSTVEPGNAGISFRVKAGEVLPSPGISKYYVSPDGEDNPDRGAIDKPFRTIAYAASVVPPFEGDTIVLGQGTFVETMPIMLPVGVNLTGAGELLTTISSKGVKIPANINQSSPDFKLWYDGSLIQLVSKHNTIFRKTNSTVIAPENGNQTLSGFTIDGNQKMLKAGIWVENRNNVTMHHVTFKNLAQRGAVFAPGNKEWYKYPAFYMKNIKIHDCVFINSGKDLTDETLGNLNIAQLDSSEIYNITINDTEGYGIKFIYDGYFKNLKIYNCNITLNESDAKWGEDISIELWNLGPGNEIHQINCNTWISLVNHPEIFGSTVIAENVKLHNVKMIDQDGISSKESVEIGCPGAEIYNSYFGNKGFGVAVWDMGRHSISIHHNIFYNAAPQNNWAGGAAVYIDNSRTWSFEKIHIQNNIFDGVRMGIKIKGANILDINIRNNVFQNTGVSDVESMAQNVIFSHNLKNNTANGWMLTGEFQQSSNYFTDPGFRAQGDRWGTFYQASSVSSNIVDKGTNVGFTYNGSAPDIGRWEF